MTLDERVRRYRAGGCAVCGDEDIEQQEFPHRGWQTVMGPRCRSRKSTGMLGYNYWLAMRRAGLHDGERAGKGDHPMSSRWTPLMLSDVFLGGPPDVEATDEAIAELEAEREAREPSGQPSPG